MIEHVTIFLTHAKSRLVRFVIKVLIDFINSLIYFFNKNKKPYAL